MPPVADHAGVVADAALPADWRFGLGTEHDHSAGTGPVAGPAATRQRGLPGGSGVTSTRRPHDVAQLFGQPACRSWGVLGKVEEVVQVGDQHSPDGIDRGAALSWTAPRVSDQD